MKAVRWILALVITYYWSLVAVSLALSFAVLAGISFVLTKFVPGARVWGMRFSRRARWSWTSIPRVFRAVAVKR